MFICDSCAEANLSDAGKSWFWPRSAGGCEMCRCVHGVCQDVPSGCDWAWKSVKEKKVEGSVERCREKFSDLFSKIGGVV